MSVTLAAMADALIEFILSLLRDPEAAAEFEQDPEAALESRGLSGASAADVCSVAPVVAESPHVLASETPAPTPAPKPAPEHNHDHDTPVIREIKSVMNSLTYVDNHNTIVDQSVNQNIWAGGDVTQVFDQEAVVASGEDSVAVGDDLNTEHNLDNSTNIGNSGEGDVLVGSDKDVTENDDSNNTTTDTETNTDASTDTTIVDSGNDSSDTTTVDDSFNDTDVDYTEQNAEVDADVVFDSDEVVVADTATDDTF